MDNKKINFMTVALMYVGTIMGAGFASGRESWQFFGVFGHRAYLGILISGCLFMALGMMVSYIAVRKHTNDMGKIIVPLDNPIYSEIVGYFMAAILYTIIVSMSAAGGSFLNQQFGVNKAIGGIIIVLLVIITVLGDFERISKVFRLIIPILFAVVVICSIIIIFSDVKQSGRTSGFPPSDMAKTWYVSAVIFISYNMLGMISVVASSSIRAKNTSNAVIGSGLGGIMLAIMSMVLVIALQKDMEFTQSLDLPMLGFSAKIGKIANIVYGAVLFAAIYSAATSTYYGFTTKIKEGKKKKYIIIIGAILGFFAGMCGFKTIVAYLYPIEGYIGLLIIALITINFIKTVIASQKNNFKKNSFDYPENICRVTAGSGGESLLIFGKNKTVLYDTGMAYCHEGLVFNIEKALSERKREKLDMVIISHTHYDHIGALPYVIKRWPDVVVKGSAKAKHVFTSEGAKKTMKRLGEAARDNFDGPNQEILVDPLRVDSVVEDGDTINIGDSHFVVLETKGHTDCSLTYVLEPDSIMFASESTGVLINSNDIHTAFLKSYEATINSAQKCKAYNPKHIISPHFGIVPDYFVKDYFNLYMKFAENEKNFVLKQRDKGLSKEEIYIEFEKKYWSVERGKSQPKAAFKENAVISINTILEDF